MLAHLEFLRMADVTDNISEHIMCLLDTAKVEVLDIFAMLGVLSPR